MSARNSPDRFWARVDRSGGPDACWPYTGAVDQYGYGIYYTDGKKFYAHRYAFSLVSGPAKGLVCHHCDNPPCCNPVDLYDGDASSNRRDQTDRNRRRPYAGESVWSTKLSDAQVDEIARLYGTGEYTQLQLAHIFGIDRSNVSRIVTGQRKRTDGTPATVDKRMAGRVAARKKSEEYFRNLNFPL